MTQRHTEPDQIAEYGRVVAAVSAGLRAWSEQPGYDPADLDKTARIAVYATLRALTGTVFGPRFVDALIDGSDG